LLDRGGHGQQGLGLRTPGHRYCVVLAARSPWRCARGRPKDAAGIAASLADPGELIELSADEWP
jgi:hypothetical protein